MEEFEKSYFMLREVYDEGVYLRLLDAESGIKKDMHFPKFQFA